MSGPLYSCEDWDRLLANRPDYENDPHDLSEIRTVIEDGVEMAIRDCSCGTTTGVGPHATVKRVSELHRREYRDWETLYGKGGGA